MNKIFLIGNLTKDPESSTTQGGVNFTRFTIAVNRPFANSSGERVADYFDIICWRQLAERCSKYLFKGSKVGICGSVQRRQYEDRDGIKRTSFEVVPDEVEFLSPKLQSNETPSNQPQAVKPTAQQNTRDNVLSGQIGGVDSLISGMQEVDPDDLPF